MLKDKLIKDLGDLQLAIQSEDIPTIIHQISTHKIESRDLEEFTRGLLMDDIKQYIIDKRLEKLRINRTNEYGYPIFDCYKIGGDEQLIRNGSPARYTSLGKLYAAYKKIYKLD